MPLIEEIHFTRNPETVEEFYLNAGCGLRKFLPLNSSLGELALCKGSPVILSQGRFTTSKHYV